MIVCRTAAGRCSSAAKILVAACGFAGCTGGPGAPTASTETPSALVQPDGATQPATATVGYARLGDGPANAATARATGPVTRSGIATAAAATRRTVYPTAAAQSVRPRSRTVPALSDPFVNRRDAHVATVAANAARPTQAQGRVQTVSHIDEEFPWATGLNRRVTQVSGETAGVVRVQDNRLPPAAPLGATNPFNRAAATSQKTTGSTVAARRVSPPVASKQPAAPSYTPVSTHRREKPVTIEAYLAGEQSIGKPAPQSVKNHDMIVDAAILPRRTDWSAELLPDAGQSSFPISPRRTFGTTDWENDQPTASANVPVTITPASATRVGPSLTPGSALRFDAPTAPAATPFAGPDLSGDASVPDDQFSDLEPEPTESLPGPVATRSELAIPTAPFAAPAPPTIEPEILAEVSGPAIATGTDNASGPALAVATSVTEKLPTETARETAETIVRPLDLHDATLEDQPAADSKPSTAAPLIVGLALAVVAIGAVLFRRRLA